MKLIIAFLVLSFNAFSQVAQPIVIGGYTKPIVYGNIVAPGVYYLSDGTTVRAGLAYSTTMPLMGNDSIITKYTVFDTVRSAMIVAGLHVDTTNYLSGLLVTDSGMFVTKVPVTTAEYYTLTAIKGYGVFRTERYSKEEWSFPELIGWLDENKKPLSKNILVWMVQKL